MHYDAANDQFIANWKLGSAVGEVRIEVRVEVGTGGVNTLSETITVVT